MPQNPSQSETMCAKSALDHSCGLLTHMGPNRDGLLIHMGSDRDRAEAQVLVPIGVSVSQEMWEQRLHTYWTLTATQYIVGANHLRDIDGQLWDTLLSVVREERPDTYYTRTRR